MSPKKKKRPQAAQALIDELLDEKNSPPSRSELDNSDPMLLQVDDTHKPGSAVPTENDFPSMDEISLGGDNRYDIDLSLDISKPHELDPVAKANRTSIADRTQLAQFELPEKTPEKKAPTTSKPPPFEGTSPLVTRMSKRESGTDDPDFSLMSDEAVSDEQDKAKSAREQEIEEAIEEATMRIEIPELQAAPEVDATVPVSRDIRQSKPKVSEPAKPIDRGADATEIRPGHLKLAQQNVYSAPNQPSNLYSAASAVFASSEAALKQSESLRIAQNRINELEQELERLRRENEDLAAAGETLRRRADELIGKTESLEVREREAQRIADEERKVMRGQLQAKDRENAELRARVEEIELRLESNFKKIRVRERELEHRLEIVKMETATLVSTKDKMILDLKRQLDQLIHENDLAKAKSQEMYNQNKDKQETIRRVVRALRIALTILEGDDENVVPLKKAE